MSRPHFDVATLRQQETFRDIKAMSRHYSSVPRSRPQNGVATPFLLLRPKPGRTLCRDINFMLRPHWRQPYVATSTSCRDLLHCHPCRDLTMMSRHQACSAPFLLHRDAILPCRDVLCSRPCRDLTMMSRHQATLKASNPVANPARSRRPFLVATSRPTNPGRDLTLMS